MRTLRRFGGGQKTFYIYSEFEEDKQFLDLMRKEFEQRGWKESSELPVDFIFLYYSYERPCPIPDTKKSKLVNLIKGDTFEDIVDAERFLTKFKHHSFIVPHKLFSDKVPFINEECSLFPVSNKFLTTTSRDGKLFSLKRSIKNSEEIQTYINQHPQVKKWMLRHKLDNPVLKGGRIFHLNFIIVVKLNPYSIHIVKNKLYTKAQAIYSENEYKTNPKTFATLELVKETPEFFPESFPDNWTKEETENMNTVLENTIQTIFKEKDFKPDNNSKGGYFIFNAFTRLYDNAPPIIFYIYNIFLPSLHEHLVPGLMRILIDSKEHPDFKKITIKNESLIPLENNFKFSRFFSFNDKFHIKINVTGYPTYSQANEDKFTGFLQNIGLEKSTSFPVRFIYLMGESTYYRNRFDTKGSEWISLLYGTSKTVLTNKILLHKEFKGHKFLVDSEIINNGISPNFKGIHILKPLNGFRGEGIKITDSKQEADKHLSENVKYSEWIIQRYLDKTDLLDGYKFHFRIFILVVAIKNIKRRVYVSRSKFYRIAEKKYKRGDYHDTEIHDTHYNKKDEDYRFPEILPDNWKQSDAEKIDKEINQIFKEVFKHQYGFKPEWNALNGFELFGADVIFEEKRPYILEINTKIGGGGNIDYFKEGLIDLILNNKPTDDFEQIL